MGAHEDVHGMCICMLMLTQSTLPCSQFASKKTLPFIELHFVKESSTDGKFRVAAVYLRWYYLAPISDTHRQFWLGQDSQFDNFDHLTRRPRANSHHADTASESHRGQVHQAVRVAPEGHVPSKELVLSSISHLSYNLT